MRQEANKTPSVIRVQPNAIITYPKTRGSPVVILDIKNIPPIKSAKPHIKNNRHKIVIFFLLKTILKALIKNIVLIPVEIEPVIHKI